MRDRWKNRTDTPPGKGTVYWHILMGGYPEVRSLAEKAQNQLSGFNGLHMTPLDWLHISTLVVGNTDDVTSDQIQGMATSASELLAHVPPITINLKNILYHPEAIMLGVDPTGALDPLLHAARTATKAHTRRTGHTTNGSKEWVPHMTLCYSTTEQDAAPLITSLGFQLSDRQVTVKKLSLVIQWGPERLWTWEPVASVLLRGAR